MSNPIEVFNVIADNTTKEGEPLISRTEGELAAAIAGLIGFAFKDHLGQVVLPTLTTDGKLPVSSDSGGTHIEDSQAVLPAPAKSRTATAVLTLVPDKLYKLNLISGACTQPVFWEVEQDDDGAQAIKHRFITGTGAPTHAVNAGCLEVTAGSTGVQTLTLYGTQISGPNSDLNGTICALQIGA